MNTVPEAVAGDVKPGDTVLMDRAGPDVVVDVKAHRTKRACVTITTQRGGSYKRFADVPVILLAGAAVPGLAIERPALA